MLLPPISRGEGREAEGGHVRRAGEEWAWQEASVRGASGDLKGVGGDAPTVDNILSHLQHHVLDTSTVGALMSCLGKPDWEQ